MKKLFALALVVFGLAACQTEPQFDVQMGGEQEVMLTVSLPEATRANSAEGAFGNVDWNTYTLRYILEVYRVVDATTNELTTTCQRFVKTSDDLTMVFPVRLAPGYQYQVVAWADIVEENSEADRYYDTDSENGLKAISIIENDTIKWNAMDETRDAYTATQTISTDNLVNGVELKLKRPFAKLRVVATDITDIRKVGLEPKTATVKYTQDMYVKYNAVEDKCIADGAKKKEHEYTYATTASKYEDVNNCVEYTLFADYIFVPSTGTAKFDLTVKDADGNIINKEIGYFNTDIPVERNKLTTISGNVLTYGNGISVNIEESEEETEWPNTMAEQLAYVGIVGGEVTLTENVELTKPVVINAGVNAVINLNDHDIINTTKSETFGEGEGIIAYGNLTIKGKGTVQGSTMAVWARGNADAVVNIYGGTYKGCEEGFAKGGRSVIYASSDNTVNIYGGTFEALAADKTSYADKTNGVYAALNVQDNHGTINVCGGTFKNFNPAVPGTEPASWMQTHPNGFVANGYKSRNVEGSMTDYEVYDATILVDKANLNEILADLKTTTETEVLLKLSEDLIPEKTIDVPAGKNVHLDLNGQTITIDPEKLTPNGSSHYAFIIREGGSLTIDGNGTVEATTPAPIMFYPGGDLVIESGTFIRHIPEGYTGKVGSMFVGTKPAGGWDSTCVTINGGYFDCGYYPAVLKEVDVEKLITGEESLVETETDKAKRGQPGDNNVIRTALKDLVSKAFNRSNNNFLVYGGTFVGANPAWGDEGGMLPRTPNFLQPWSYYQGAFLKGQSINNGIGAPALPDLPEGYTITKSTHDDGRPIYTVTYNK